MKQQMISRLEGGTAQPTVTTVERYLRRLGLALGVSLIDEECDEQVDRLVLNEELRAREFRSGQFAYERTSHI